jgi:hypothetical protein
MPFDEPDSGTDQIVKPMPPRGAAGQFEPYPSGIAPVNLVEATPFGRNFVLDLASVPKNPRVGTQLNTMFAQAAG